MGLIGNSTNFRSHKTIREEIEERERLWLSPMATLSSRTKGRRRSEEKCSIRTDFQRDRDRIIHSKSFRRLKHKTQVFLAPTGDHYRTRLTHTLEVSQISRTIARALRLNEDLTEAIALGHDLGHTPFGHAGESILNKIMKDGFHHAEQSLRVVDIIEDLNLTYEVREGIRYHSKGKGDIVPETLKLTQEAIVVRFSDVIAYVNHDLDDAIRAGIFRIEDVPESILKELGRTHRERIDTLVKGVVNYSLATGKVGMDEGLYKKLVELRDFLYEKLYYNPIIRREFDKACKIIEDLFFYFKKHPEKYLKEAGLKDFYDDEEKCIGDFISGMTDRFALSLYEKLFIPKPLF